MASKSIKLKDPYRLKFSVSMTRLRYLRSVNPYVLSASFISRRSMVEVDLMKRKE